MYSPSAASLLFMPSSRSVQARAPIHRTILPKGMLISVAFPKSRPVECIQGLIWITHDGEPHDIILSAGQRHCPTSNARMIVQALEKSTLRIQTPQESGLAASVGRWVAQWLLPGGMSQARTL